MNLIFSTEYLNNCFGIFFLLSVSDFPFLVKSGPPNLVVSYSKIYAYPRYMILPMLNIASSGVANETLWRVIIIGIMGLELWDYGVGIIELEFWG